MLKEEFKKEEEKKEEVGKQFNETVASSEVGAGQLVGLVWRVQLGCAALGCPGLVWSLLPFTAATAVGSQPAADCPTGWLAVRYWLAGTGLPTHVIDGWI